MIEMLSNIKYITAGTLRNLYFSRNAHTYKINDVTAASFSSKKYEFDIAITREFINAINDKCACSVCGRKSRNFRIMLSHISDSIGVNHLIPIDTRYNTYYTYAIPKTKFNDFKKYHTMTSNKGYILLCKHCYEFYRKYVTQIEATSIIKSDFFDKKHEDEIYFDNNYSFFKLNTLYDFDYAREILLQNYSGCRTVTLQRLLFEPYCVSCGIKAKYAIKVKENKYWNSVLIYAEDIHGNLIQMTTDHIVPKSLGGTNQRTNLQTMCEICNHSKQNYNNIDYNKYYYNGETNEFYSII